MKQVAVFALTVLLAGTCLGQARLPTSNPLQTLPIAPTPVKAPTVATSVQPEQNAQMQALLAHRVQVTRVDVTGVHAMPVANAVAMFRHLVGKDDTVGDILTAANTCSAAYRQRGFALSFCFVPNQDFVDGVVRIVAVEGYVAEVSITGDVGNYDQRIRHIAARIQRDRPLRQGTFERYVQILGTLPGITVTANVPAPTTTDGASRLELKVERKRIDGSMAVDANHPGVQGLVTLTENGLTPLGEQLSLSALFPPGRGSQQFYAGSWTQPLGSDGVTGKLDASRYRGDPDTDDGLPSNLDHRLRQDRIGLSLRAPVLLSYTRSLAATVSVYANDQTDSYRNDDNGATLALDTHARVVAGDLDYRQAAGRSTSQLTFSIGHGIDAFGAYARTRSNVAGVAGEAGSDVSFMRYGFGAAFATAWPDQVGTVFTATGQYSPDRLPSGEQIGFGGPRFGLAYDPGSATGDSGWGAAYEVNKRFAPGYTWLKTLTPYVAVQFARVYLNQGQPLLSKLGSVALGLRLADTRHYSVDVSVAQPVGDKPIDAGSRQPRVNLAFSYRLH
jgi:hemolysin activation/secretion protein